MYIVLMFGAARGFCMLTTVCFQTLETSGAARGLCVLFPTQRAAKGLCVLGLFVFSSLRHQAQRGACVSAPGISSSEVLMYTVGCLCPTPGHISSSLGPLSILGSPGLVYTEKCLRPAP